VGGGRELISKFNRVFLNSKGKKIFWRCEVGAGMSGGGV